MSRLHSPRCHYCGKVVFGEDRTWDHIVPKIMGGPNTITNLVTSCVACNSTKGKDFPTCECAFCRTAINLWENRQRERGASTSRNPDDYGKAASQKPRRARWGRATPEHHPGHPSIPEYVRGDH